jgi:hypothetical protein
MLCHAMSCHALSTNQADNLPLHKSKFFFFKGHSLVWCSDAKLRDQEERLHSFDLSTARVVAASPLGIQVQQDPLLVGERTTK